MKKPFVLHDVIAAKEAQFYRRNKRDRRRINETWESKNFNDEWFIFGRYGSGKNAVIVTLAMKVDGEWRPV